MFAVGRLFLILDFAIEDVDQVSGIIRIGLHEVRSLEPTCRTCGCVAGQLIGAGFSRERRAVVAGRVDGVGDAVLGVGDECCGLLGLVLRIELIQVRVQYLLYPFLLIYDKNLLAAAVADGS